ncbi:transposase [Saccharothrix saharensis]|uniref:transposase n=1 Tax=Saccharothrix saharensis TaxID=571190 RepID=UPI0036BE1A06
MLPPDPRNPLLPRLLLHRRRQALGVTRRRKSIRAARPDGGPIYVIMDDLSANTTPDIRKWARRNEVELCLTPTYASWANPIEPQFGPLRTFVIANSTPTSRCWLVNCNDICAGATPTPDVLDAQRRERARIRSERHQRWGRPRAA